jgi:hypothetical protein
MEIKLIDHVGETQSGVFVDHQQWIVFADDVQVGYLPKTPDSWLQCIVYMDEAVKKELTEALNAKVASEIGGVVLPPDPDFDPDAEDEDE